MLKLERLSKYYTSNDQVVKALDSINLSFEIGEFVVITGESGSGKSTLLNVISGLDSFEDGELWINDEETSYYDTEDWENYRKKYIGFIFQRFNIIDAYTVYDNVLLALKLSSYPKKDRKKRALELIESVGLSPQAKQKTSKLSGGQKQRVAIARALAKDAPIIVADEPTGNLDQDTARKILALLKTVAQDKLVILVTHNAEEVADIATRKIRIFDGKIQEDKILKKTAPVQESLPSKTEKTSALSLWTVALRNLFSMPKRTLLMGLISVFIVGVFMLSYGSYVDQSNTPGFSFHPVFSSRSEHRLVVTHVDGIPLDANDLATFNQIDAVKSVVQFDPVLDLYLQVEDPVNAEFSTPYHFMPASSLSENTLSEGRLPVNASEIVMPDNQGGLFSFGTTYQLGQVISAYVSIESFRFSSLPNASTFYTVVGLHSLGTSSWPEMVYVDDSLLANSLLINQALAKYHRVRLEFEGTALFTLDTDFNLFLDDTLDVDDIFINGVEAEATILPQFFPELSLAEFIELEFEMSVQNPFNDQPRQIPFTFSGALSNQIIDAKYGSNSLIIAHPSAWAGFLDNQTYQMTLIVEDAFAAQRVQDSLPERYFSIYPAGYQEPFEAIFGVIANIFQIFSTIFILFVMYLVSYLALKNVMKSRQKDYVIMRSIGASKRDLNTITILELMMMMTVAFIGVYGALLGNAIFDFGWPNYLRFYTVFNYILALSLLLIMMVFLGLRFNKKIFTQTVQTAMRGE